MFVRILDHRYPVGKERIQQALVSSDTEHAEQNFKCVRRIIQSVGQETGNRLVPELGECSVVRNGEKGIQRGLDRIAPEDGIAE